MAWRFYTPETQPYGYSYERGTKGETRLLAQTKQAGFDVLAWRRRPIWQRFLILIGFCRHREMAEIVTAEDRTRDSEDSDPYWMLGVKVSACCRCGKVFTAHGLMLRDRTPGAMGRWIEARRLHREFMRGL